MPHGASSVSFKYKPHNIFKNLLRDIKIFIKEKFDSFVAKSEAHFLELGISKAILSQISNRLLPLYAAGFLLRELDIDYLETVEA